ncbi:hypothetical protein HNQ79_006775, partial [Streptomyces candidus]|nr:hypothetical protein [Streptomyces candidus]
MVSVVWAPAALLGDWPVRGFVVVHRAFGPVAGGSAPRTPASARGALDRPWWKG